MQARSKREQQLAIRMKELTGKSINTCILCLRHHHGNYLKALKMCNQTSDSEGERCNRKLVFTN